MRNLYYEDLLIGTFDVGAKPRSGGRGWFGTVSVVVRRWLAVLSDSGWWLEQSRLYKSMLRELSLSVRPVLAFLLIVLTPLGTGQGAHRDQLLDPVFPHIHLGGGPPSANPAALAAAERAFMPKTPGPALGAGSGLTSTPFGVGLTPPVPDGAAVIPTQRLVRRLSVSDRFPTAALAEAPPDPPPPAA